MNHGQPSAAFAGRIEVLDGGVARALWASPAVHESSASGGLRCEETVFQGILVSRQRTAALPLIRLQVQGSTLLKGRKNGRTEEHLLGRDSLAIFQPGFTLNDLEWQHTASRVLIVSLDPASLEIDAATAQTLWERLSFGFGFVDPVLLALMRALHARLEAACHGGERFLDGIGVAMAAHLSQKYCETKDGNRPNGPSALSKAIDFMGANLEVDICLGDLADKAGLSPSHFSHAFRRRYGVPPMSYLTSLRIESAHHMLATGAHSIAEIALRTGFSSQSSFTTAFTRTMGVAPAQARRRARLR